MLARLFVVIGFGFVGVLGYLQIAERGRDHAATVVFEQVFDPSQEASATISQGSEASAAVGASTVESSGLTDAGSTRMDGAGTVLPEPVPEARELLATQPALDLLTGSNRPALVSSVAPADDMLADLPTSSLVAEEEQSANALGDDETELPPSATSEESVATPLSEGSAADTSIGDDVTTDERGAPDRPEGERSANENKAESAGTVTVRMMTIDVGMVALRSAPSQNSLISGTAQRGDILTAVPVEGTNWMLVQDARSGAIGYLPRTVLRDILR